MHSNDSSGRVAILVGRFSKYGGTEGFSWRLSEALARRGHKVDVICGRQETEAPAGVEVVKVGRPPLTRVFKVVWFALKAREAVRQNRYAVVVSLGNTLEQDLCRVSGGPLPVFQRLSLRAYAPTWRKVLKAVRRMLAPSNWAIRLIQKRQFSPENELVAVSHTVRDWLVQCHPELDPKNIRVVYNKPDLTRFSPPSDDERKTARAKYDLPAGTRALTLAGTNFALKGVETAIRALARLPEDFVLMIAGGRRPGRFAALADELGVGKRVRFLGKVDDMRTLYHASDLFVLPSYYDTCSNAVLEAMACGVPAVSSATNGSSYFLPADQVLGDPADDASLARIVESTMKKDGLEDFLWPEDVPSGIEPYVEMIEERLKKR